MGDSLAAAFDIGNVLCEVNLNEFARCLAKYIMLKRGYIVNYEAEVGVSGHLIDEANFFIDHIRRMQDIGTTTVREQLQYKYNFTNFDLDELIKAWNKTVTPNEMMLKFLDKLKNKGVKIALLSNMGQEHLKYLRAICPAMFEGTIQHISCEVGARKPQKLFYQSFLLDHKEFSGCIYVDDLEENVRVGRQYGFKEYHFDLAKMLDLPKTKQKTSLELLEDAIYYEGNRS